MNEVSLSPVLKDKTHGRNDCQEEFFSIIIAASDPTFLSSDPGYIVAITCKPALVYCKIYNTIQYNTIQYNTLPKGYSEVNLQN